MVSKTTVTASLLLRLCFVIVFVSYKGSAAKISIDKNPAEIIANHEKELRTPNSITSVENNDEDNSMKNRNIVPVHATNAVEKVMDSSSKSEKEFSSFTPSTHSSSELTPCRSEGCLGKSHSEGFLKQLEESSPSKSPEVIQLGNKALSEDSLGDVKDNSQSTKFNSAITPSSQLISNPSTPTAPRNLPLTGVTPSTNSQEEVSTEIPSSMKNSNSSEAPSSEATPNVEENNPPSAKTEKSQDADKKNTLSSQIITTTDDSSFTRSSASPAILSVSSPGTSFSIDRKQVSIEQPPENSSKLLVSPAFIFMIALAALVLIEVGIMHAVSWWRKESAPPTNRFFRIFCPISSCRANGAKVFTQPIDDTTALVNDV